MRDLTDVVPMGPRARSLSPPHWGSPHRQGSKDVHILARNLLNYTNSFQQRLTGHQEMRKQSENQKLTDGVSTCRWHEAPARFISFVCHRSPSGIRPFREAESYLLTHSTNVYECLQCCNYCARHRLKDKLKAEERKCPHGAESYDTDTASRGGKEAWAPWETWKSCSGNQGSHFWQEEGRTGGEEDRVGFLEETAPELVFKEREDCNRTGVSFPSGGWSGAFSLPLTSCSLCRDNHISLLYWSFKEHPTQVPSGSLLGHRLLQPCLQESPMSQLPWPAPFARLSPHGGPEMLQGHVCLSPAHPWASSRCPAKVGPKRSNEDLNKWMNNVATISWKTWLRSFFRGEPRRKDSSQPNG